MSSPVTPPPGLLLIQHVCLVAAQHILAGTTSSGLVFHPTCMFCCRLTCPPRNHFLRGRFLIQHVCLIAAPHILASATCSCWITNKPGGNGTDEDLSGGDKTHMLDEKQAQRTLRGFVADATQNACWSKHKPTGRCTGGNMSGRDKTCMLDQKQARKKWYWRGYVGRRQNAHVGSETSAEEVVLARICLAATKHTRCIKHKRGGSCTGEDMSADATCMFCRCRASF